MHARRTRTLDSVACSCSFSSFLLSFILLLLIHRFFHFLHLHPFHILFVVPKLSVPAPPSIHFFSPTVYSQLFFHLLHLHLLHFLFTVTVFRPFSFSLLFFYSYIHSFFFFFFHFLHPYPLHFLFTAIVFRSCSIPLHILSLLMLLFSCSHILY